MRHTLNKRHRCSRYLCSLKICDICWLTGNKNRLIFSCYKNAFGNARFFKASKGRELFVETWFWVALKKLKNHWCIAYHQNASDDLCSTPIWWLRVLADLCCQCHAHSHWQAGGQGNGHSTATEPLWTDSSRSDVLILCVMTRSHLQRSTVLLWTISQLDIERIQACTR